MGAGADPAINGRALCANQRVRQSLDDRRLYAAIGRDLLRAEIGHARPQRIEPFDQALQMPQAHGVPREQDICHAQHERCIAAGAQADPLVSSEETTSELQSLMSIPYAVFGLKTKNTTTTTI